MNKKLFLWLVIGVIMVAPIGSTGTPDYGKSLSSNPTVQSYEPGEDTTRLLMGGGSNARSGRWIWATGFESGLAEVDPFAAAGGTLPTIDTTKAYMGKQSLKIQHAAVVGAYGNVRKYLYSPVVPEAENSRFGLESMMAIFIDNKPMRISWRMVTQLPQNLFPNVYCEYRIRLEVIGNGDGDLYYFNNAGAYTLIAPVDAYLFNLPTMFHYSKLVIDANTGLYSKFIFDNAAYDLSGIQCRQLAGTAPYLYNEIQYESRTAVANVAGVWIDNVVITADEP